MKLKPNFSFCLVVVMFLSSFASFAQFDDGIEPPPAAPIDQYEYFAVLFAVVFVFLFFVGVNKFKSKTQSS